MVNLPPAADRILASPVPGPAAPAARTKPTTGSVQRADAARTVAVATDKVALLPGQTATRANITGYSKGLNGIIIDVANLENLPRYEDFSFTVGTGGDPSPWAVAPVPTYVNTYPGRGPGGS